MYTSFCCCFDLAGRRVVFKASLLCLAAESLCAFPSAPSSLTLLWRWAEHRNLTKEWAVPSVRGSSSIPLNDYICSCSTQQQQQCGALGLQLCPADGSPARWTSASQVFHVLPSVNAAQLHQENGHRGLSLHCYERRGAVGLQAARGQGAEAAFANRQGRSMTEIRCWSFVSTDDRSTLFKSILLPGKWLVQTLLWCLFEFTNGFHRDSTGADSVGFNKKGLLLLGSLQILLDAECFTCDMMCAFQLLFASLSGFECTRHVAKLNLILGNAASVIYLW